MLRFVDRNADLAKTDRPACDGGGGLDAFVGLCRRLHAFDRQADFARFCLENRRSIRVCANLFTRCHPPLPDPHRAARCDFSGGPWFDRGHRPEYRRRTARRSNAAPYRSSCRLCRKHADRGRAFDRRCASRRAGRSCQPVDQGEIRPLRAGAWGADSDRVSTGDVAKKLAQGAAVVPHAHSIDGGPNGRYQPSPEYGPLAGTRRSGRCVSLGCASEPARSGREPLFRCGERRRHTVF